MNPTVPVLEPAFDVSVDLAPIADHGITRAGHRRVITILGGTITDAGALGGLALRIEPGGADWQRVRPDGAMEIDGRYSAIGSDGDRVYLQAQGVRSGPADVLAALGRGERVDPDRYYFRTTVTIETSSPRLTHLQDALFVASCIREASTVRYRAYRVT
ncbi:DUF3237 domain-containing protein [Microbacterium sp.]|uniref:DUF3237 domain-containing protein n=1 Tax=Microbacterium sp. TaxID=51671 RepID=UPI0039E6B7E2